MLCRVYRRRVRRGFTLIEMLVAMMILGAVTAMAYPRWTSMRKQSDFRSAKSHVAAYIMATQAGAIRRGTTATLLVSGGKMWSMLDNSGTSVNLLAPADIQKQYGVTLTSNRSTVQYDMRGVPKALPAMAIIWISGAGKRDSVCISRGGMLMRQGCTL